MVLVLTKDSFESAYGVHDSYDSAKMFFNCFYPALYNLVVSLVFRTEEERERSPATCNRCAREGIN